MIEIVSLIISLVSILISLYLIFFDRVRLEIISIIPATSGTRSTSHEAFKNFIISIEVTICNKGKRDALNCEGIVTFKRLDPLFLFLSEKGEALTDNRKFNVFAGEEKNLVAAWSFSGKSINGSSGLDKSSFLEKAPPIIVTINFGRKRVRKKMTEKEIEKFLRTHEEELHRHS